MFRVLGFTYAGKHMKTKTHHCSSIAPCVLAKQKDT